MERTKQGELTWTDLSARDLDAQTRFYEALFGWIHNDVLFGGRVYRLFSINGHVVGGASEMPTQAAEQGTPSVWNTYVAVDDVDTEALLAARLGGKVVVPPTDVPRGRMAGIEDPTGAVLYLWASSTPDDSEVYETPGTLAWANLETHDPAMAAQFFGRLMDCDVQALNEGSMPQWQISVNGHTEGSITSMPAIEQPDASAHWLDYFGTADLDASLEKAKSLGGTVLAEPLEVAGTVSFAVLEDPEGAKFALMQSLQVA